MKVLGVSGEEQKALWLILGAVYHLGAAGATKGRRTMETPRLKTQEFLGRIPLFQGKKTWIQTCQIKRDQRMSCASPPRQQVAAFGHKSIRIIPVPISGI